MQYKTPCVFCKIVKGDVKSEKVAECDNFFAILDIKPKTKGHVLVISKKHFVTLLDIPDRLGSELISFIKKISSEMLGKKIGDGFNVLMNNLRVAGQVVEHAHFHILPRKEGDKLKVIE
jgi:histidine triad (HIT) family protein